MTRPEFELRRDLFATRNPCSHLGNSSIVGPDRVVFNIKGNDYRLVVGINYEHRVVFIKWIGSHAEYDKIDVRTVSYGHQAD